MYGDLDVLFLTDEYDTVLAYENKGKVDQAADRTDPLMDTLNSMSRVQQVELICGEYCSNVEIHDVHKVSFTTKKTYMYKDNKYLLFSFNTKIVQSELYSRPQLHLLNCSVAGYSVAVTTESGLQTRMIMCLRNHNTCCLD